MKLAIQFNRLSVRSILLTGAILALGCSRPLDTQSEPSENNLGQRRVLAALPPGGGLSTADLQLQVTTYACASNQVLDAFQVKNAGASAVRLSDIGIRFWANDTTSQAMVAGVSYGGCVFGAQGCYHQVTGASASAAAVSPACGPDASHLASWEIAVATTDTAMLNPGETWSGLQTTAHLADYSSFSPGTSTWYSACLNTNSQYVSDSHYAVYYQGNLVYAAGMNAPACRGPRGSQPLTGYVTPEIASRPLVGRVPAATPIDLAISLPVRNAAGLKQLVRNVSDPTKPNTYRKYITPAQFTATYGPLDGDYSQLQQWASTKGLTILKSHSNNVLLDVRGAAATIEKALYVNLNYRLRADGTQFYAPDREPSIDVTPTVLRVSQLDNLKIAKPLIDEDNAALLGPDDYRGAYLKCLQNLDGDGQWIGLLSYSAFNLSDVEDYETASGIPQSKFTTVDVEPINGFSTVPDSTSRVTEPTLDVDMALSMAPRAHIHVYEAKADVSTNTLLNAMATSNPLILNLASSWGTWNDDATQQILDEMAAQGQSFFLASGDDGAWGNDAGAAWAQNMDNITVVGGTSPQWAKSDVLYLAGEYGWYGSGGGPLKAAIPFYQPKVATTNYDPSAFFPGASLPLSRRMVPDVAAFASGVEIYLNGKPKPSGGTSSATPLWAGFMALVNQQNGKNTLPPVGFANPALYYIGTSANYGAAFTDLAEGTTNPGPTGASYATVQGYDLVTGWGSPTCGLITKLSTPCVASDTDPDNCGACWHSCQGGACVAGVCQRVALTTGGDPLEPLDYQELALTREKVVAAATRVLSQGLTYAEIQAVNLDGTNPVTYKGGDGTRSSGGVVADVDKGVAHWSLGGTIHEFDLTAGTDKSRGVEAARLADGPMLYALVDVGASSYIRYLNMNFDPPQGGIAATNITSPANMAVRGTSASGAKILVASSQNANADPASGSILLFVGLSGTKTVLASNQDFPTDIVTDADYVYWANRGYVTGKLSINRVAITGGTPAVLATSSTSGISTSIAVDWNSVYYTDNDTHALMKMAKDGTGKTVLVPNAYRDALHGLAADSTSIYWLDDSGVIWKMAKP